MESTKKVEEPVVKWFEEKKALGISFVKYSKKKRFLYGGTSYQKVLSFKCT